MGRVLAACRLVPPHMLDAMTRSPDHRIREVARHNQAAADRSRRAPALGSKAVVGERGGAAEAGKVRRVVRDAGQEPRFDGKVRRREGDPPTGNRDVDDVYRNTGIVLDFYRRVFNRNGVDGKGMWLISNVEFRQTPAQPMLGAYWYRNHKAMTFGEEILEVMKRPAKALDFAGHEMTHGVVQFTAKLAHGNEPGALNESFADVMASLVKQWKKGQTASEADWLIGDTVVYRSKTVRGIRSLKAPGTAYTDDPHIGSDQQVWQMKHKYRGSKDDGGVHINSGIPNHAFYLVSATLGGLAWERAGQVWYASLLRLHPNSDFEDCAQTTYTVAAALFGRGSRVQKAVKSAWKTVGLPI